jgi:hypothetical protein
MGPLDQPTSGPPTIVRTAPANPAIASGTLAGVGPRLWQFVSLVLPVLLTAWLTFVFSRSEARVTQQLELQKQAFAQQMQLSEDLYKRRFETYDKLYTQLLLLGNEIEHLRAGGSPVLWNRRLADSLSELDTLRKMNRLHISDSVYAAMGDAWQRGSRLNGAQFGQDLDQVEAQMETELRNLMDLKGMGSQNTPRLLPAGAGPGAKAGPGGAQ